MKANNAAKKYSNKNKKVLLEILIINILILSIDTQIQLRGIVEGFYGTPWTFEDRADLIKFSHEVNFNAYIYAPKDDPYHREQWRNPYPDEKIEELKNLIALSIENNIHFIFAVSPGIDLNFYGDKGKEDFNKLLIKLNSLYEKGCRDFAIFFDDIKIKSDSGINQAFFLNKLQETLDAKYPDINPIITVPTQYWRIGMFDKKGKLKQYTRDFVNNLSKKIIVLYTGEKVVGDGLSDEAYKKATDIYKRKIGIWWNYPVNDYHLLKNSLLQMYNQYSLIPWGSHNYQKFLLLQEQTMLYLHKLMIQINLGIKPLKNNLGIWPQQ